MTTTIQEAIRLQAEAVKGKSNALQAADYLEKAAKLMRADAMKPVKVDFKAIVKARQARLDKFATNVKKGRDAEVKQLLTSAGYTPGNKPNEYVIKSKPGFVLKIEGDTFTVYNGMEEKLPSTRLTYLKNYLDTDKASKAITQSPGTI